MTSKEFDNLTDQEKCIMVSEFGILLAKRITMFGELKLISCYAIKNIIIEEHFSLENKTFEYFGSVSDDTLDILSQYVQRRI